MRTTHSIDQLRALVEAVRVFRNEPALARLAGLRKTPGYIGLCQAWDDARDWLEPVQPAAGIAEITLTAAQIDDLRAIVQDQEQPLGNRLQMVAARLHLALTGAGWTPPDAGLSTAPIRIDFKQATELLGMFGGEPSEVTLQLGKGHSGDGLYAHYTDLPEEGAMFLGVANEEAMPSKDPTRPASAVVIAVLRDACEAEPADPTALDTICIGRDHLESILQSRLSLS